MRHLDGPLSEPRANELFDRFCSGDEIAPAWGIYRRSDNRFIGHSAFKKVGEGTFEPILVFDKPYWNRGYGKESLRLMITFARRSESMQTLIATINPDHTFSRRLAESVGMTLDRWESDELGEYTVYQLDCQLVDPD